MGVGLMLEGVGTKLDKSYIYVFLAFELLLEVLHIILNRNRPIVNSLFNDYGYTPYTNITQSSPCYEIFNIIITLKITFFKMFIAFFNLQKHIYALFLKLDLGTF